MKRQLSLNRIRTQLTGLERMMRTLRAEVETHISAFSPTDINSVTEVRTGLSELFATGTAMPAISAQPYQHFYPGVWVGIDQQVGDCGATVILKTLHQHEPLDGLTRMARLSINPVFPLIEKPRWVTLENAIDIEALRAAKGLRLDIISFFDIAPHNTAQIPRHITVTLRLRRRDGAQSDHLDYHVPVSTMPFEHSMIVAESRMGELPLAEAVEAELIIALPLAGEFTLNVDHFSLKGIKA